MNNNLQLVLKSSTTEMSLNDHDAGIYIVPELDGLTGLPEIRTTSGVNAGYDGGWTSAQKFDARSIVIRGVIANEDKTEVERMRRELVALLAHGKNEQLELDFVTETGRAYEVQVRTIACDMAMQRVLTQQEFMITLRADDPLIYDNSSAGEEATVNVSGATGGFRIPFEIPLAIDAGSEETVIQNSGLESVAPTIKMYGALHNPKIINHTTNQAMQVEAELGFTEGAWTTPVDAPEGTNVSFEPEREAPIESAKLKGNTEQQTYSGKNLLNVNFTSGVSGGITITNNGDGTITASGTSTGNVAIGISPASVNNLVLQSGKTYTQRVEVISGNLNLRLVPSFKNSGGTVTYNYFVNNQSKTTTDTMTCNAYNLYESTTGLPVGSSVNFTIRVWLEEGSDLSSPYEPYVGGTASPNPDYPQAVKVVTGENVVKICGKNLLPYPYNFGTSATSDGVTVTANSDGSITINGTKASNTTTIFYLRPSFWSYNESNGIIVPAGKTVTSSLKGAESANGKLAMRSECYYADGTHDGLVTSVSSATATMRAKATLNARLLVYQGYTFNNLTVYPQIELGSATAYEPYQEQSYEVNLGKNLFDGSIYKENYVIASNGAENPANGGVITTAIKVEPNTTYTASANWDATSPDKYMRVGIYASDMTFISRQSSSASGAPTTFTTPANARYVRLSYFTHATEAQLELGSQATSYAAYFTPIELCKIGTYQDYIWKDGDTWKVHKATSKVVLDGITTGAKFTERMTANNSKYRFRISNLLALPANFASGTIAPLYCDRLIGVTMGNTWNGTRGICYNDVGNSMIIFIESLQDETLAGANTWLESNNLDVYYVLATPTDTAITNTALIEQLDALVDGNAVVYEGETNIVVTAAEGDLPGIAAIRYYTDKEPDQRDELIVDSRLKTVTLNGLDVYHLQAPGSEFLMLALGENKLSLQSDITGDNGYAKVSYKQGYLSI